MGCERCGFTGIAYEYDETAGPGYVAVPCPECRGINGQEPDVVTKGHDVLTQEDMKAEAYAFASPASEGRILEEEMAWAQHGPAW